jgi:hypothetical protein
MSGHRLPRLDRAHFRCGIVAKRKYEIECRRFRARELRPVGAQAGYVIVQLAQQIERIGMDAALMASSREGAAITRSPDRVGTHQRRVRQALIALGWKAEGISRRT